jgi:hypothetical protein
MWKTGAEVTWKSGAQSNVEEQRFSAALSAKDDFPGFSPVVQNDL